MISVSIIIPVREINAYLYKSIPIILKETDESVEIIVLPDAPPREVMNWPDCRSRIIPTGSIGPGRKRDVGARIARGETLAFLDDDAYPAVGWLGAAMAHFSDATVCAVGGPGVTPPEDPFWNQVSGAVFASLAGSGGARNRYTPVGTGAAVDDWPTVNLLVRRSAFDAVGGFNTDDFPGEDTKLCLALVEKLGMRIVYEPRAVVFHHRRPLFWKHFQQMGRYARCRGQFFRLHPRTSRRPLYALPSLLLLWTLFGVSYACFARRSNVIAAIGLGCYGVLAVSAGVETLSRAKSLVLSLATAMAVALTHVWYGVQFLRGLVVTRGDALPSTSGGVLEGEVRLRE